MNLISDHKLRRSLARLRTSSHALGVETSRHRRGDSIIESTRLCSTCNVTEDESHFMLHCPKYLEPRQKFFNNSFMDNEVFLALDDNAKLMYIFNLYEKRHLVELAQFVHRAFTIHSNMIEQ